MSYITENTIWPSVTELKPEIKNLIRRFYELADLPDPQSGNQYAIEIFTPNGTMKGPFGSGDIYVGEAGGPIFLLLIDFLCKITSFFENSGN